MKLALCNLILESATQPNFIADFLLYFINKFVFLNFIMCKITIIFLKLSLNNYFRRNDYSYVEEFDLSNGPTNDLQQLLLNICQKNNLRKKIYIGSVLEERWDFDSAISIFIDFYRLKKKIDCFLDYDKL